MREVGLRTFLRKPNVSRRLRRLFLAAILLTGLAAVGASVLLGWYAHDRLSGEPRTVVAVTVNRPIQISPQRQAALGTMPNVLGLDEQTARQVLLDAGLNAKRVGTETQAYAGESDLVVAQTPSAGAPSGEGRITLTLSAPALMPNLAGRTLADARATLATYGAGVLVRTRYQPGAAENTVLETIPRAGKKLADRATLILAEPASSVFLSQLNAVSSSCSTVTLNVAGIPRKDALECEPGVDSPATLEYLLNRRVASFTAVLGLGDRGGADTPVTFSAFVDGKRVLVQSFSFGQARRITIPVVGALRIRLEASVRSVGSSGQGPQAVFADARLLGGSGAIDALVKESTQ